MRAILLQLVCLGLAFHGLDSAITVWTGPAGGTVSSALGGASPTDSATMYVSEQILAGTIIGTAAATDGGAAAVTYTLTETTNTFKIRTTGEIYLMCNTLSYASVTSYTLTVTADEVGGSQGTLTLIVNVNAAPTVTGGNTCSCNIATATASGITLRTFALTDSNSGTGDSDSAFAITAGNAVDWTLNTGTGVLATGAILDNTITSCYKLSILGTDNGGLTAGTSNTATVAGTVTITVSATGTTASCSCYDGAAAAAVGSIMLLLAACTAQFL